MVASCSSSALWSLSPASRSTWSSDVTRRPRDGAPSCVTTHPKSPPLDLFVVPTIGFDLLYVLIVIRLERRNLVWINITPNPSAEWVARQITEAFPWTEAPRYLVRDRDRVYGAAVMHRLGAMGKPLDALRTIAAKHRVFGL